MEPDRLADLPHRGRIAVLAQVTADEVEDLPLALRQVLDEVHLTLLSQPHCMGGGRCDGRTHVRRVAPSTDGFKQRSEPNDLLRLSSAPPRAAVAELVDAQG